MVSARSIGIDLIPQNSHRLIPLGTIFEGRIVKTVSIGEFGGIVGQVRGKAQITGYHQFVVDTNDPFPEGFLL